MFPVEHCIHFIRQINEHFAEKRWLLFNIETWEISTQSAMFLYMLLYDICPQFKAWVSTY